MKRRSIMKRPTKKAFYEHMSDKLGIKYKNNTAHYMDIPDELYKKTDNE